MANMRFFRKTSSTKAQTEFRLGFWYYL